MLYTADGNLMVNRCSLNLGSSQESLCKVDLSGRLNTGSLEGGFVLDVGGISAPFLDLISRFLGMEYYFGNTKLESTSSIQITNKGNDLAFKGEFSGLDITLESSQLGLPPIRPLGLSLGYGGKFFADSTTVKVDDFSFYVDDQNARVISAKLDKPTVMTMMSGSSSSVHSPAVVKLTVDELHLDLFEPLIPEELNLDINNGRLNSQLRISIADRISEILCMGKFHIVGVNIPSRANAKNKNDSVMGSSCEFDIGYNEMAMVKINTYTINLDENGNPLVEMTLKGDFDASMTGKPSVLSLTSSVPIRAKRLHQLSEAVTQLASNNLSKEEVRKSSKDQKSPDGNNDEAEPEIVTHKKKSTPLDTAQSEIPPLNIEVNVMIPEIIYDQVIISDFNPKVKMQENKVTIDPFVFNVNEGRGRMGVSYDIKDTREPTSAGELELSNIDLQPIFNSLSPDYGHLATGSLKYVKSTFEMTGSKTDDIINSLNAESSCEFININIAQSLGAYTPLINLLSGGIVNGDDLVFDLVRFEATMKESLLTLAEASFTNPNLRLLSNGELKFVGHWVGEVGITPGYAGELAKLAEKKNLDLEKGKDDYLYTKKIPLKIDTSKDAKTLLKEWLPSVADNLLNLDQFGKEGKVIKEGVKNLGGVISGKTSVKDALKGGLGIFESYNKKEEKEKNPKEKNESTPKEEEEGEKNDIESILKDLW